ncbi:hypothetical protein [Streptomyces sp. BA2]|uniref:hypothetical protein n=1 Tax=Streptomyces sp. BA2 TaxID=436595 RepID=UPI0013229782|nr:hypothetical protein [Streptomyces sp. BA2]MWA08216.1 hypothetical protein [Streptomyces sp. BA2]
MPSYAVRILRGALCSRRVGGYDRVESMARPVRLGDRYRDTAAHTARAPSRHWQWYESDQQELIDLMLSSGEEYRPLAAEALVDFISRRDVSADDRDRAVVAVLSLGPEFRDHAVRALWGVARRRKRPRERPYDRRRAKDTLVRLSVEEALDRNALS